MRSEGCRRVGGVELEEEELKEVGLGRLSMDGFRGTHSVEVEGDGGMGGWLYCCCWGYRCCC